MLVTTVAIIAVVAFGVLAWTALRGDGGGSSGTAGSWSRLAAVDRSSGAVTILDEGGEVEREIVGRGRVDEVHGFGDRLALVGPTQIVVVTAGGDDVVTVPIDRTATVTPVRTGGGLDLIIGRPAGGNVVVVDVVTGETLDIGALAQAAEPQIFDSPLLFAETVRWSADGEAFAVADASSFQTIVVRSESTDVSFFRAQPVALNGDRVVTSQIVGGQADVEVYDTDRNSKARVPVPIPAGGLLTDGTLVMVSIDGGVYRVRDGDTEAERVARIAVPSGGSVDAVRPVHDGKRLVVSGSAFEAVVDLDGRTLFFTTFATPVEPMPTPPTWTCVPIGGDEAFHSIVDVEEGEQLVDLSGLVVGDASGNGCTVLGERAGIAEVVDAAGTVTIGPVRAARLGPDGRSVVRTTAGGDTELLRIDDDLALDEPIDLTDVVPRNPLIAFLD